MTIIKTGKYVAYTIIRNESSELSNFKVNFDCHKVSIVKQLFYDTY